MEKLCRPKMLFKTMLGRGRSVSNTIIIAYRKQHLGRFKPTVQSCPLKGRVAAADMDNWKEYLDTNNVHVTGTFHVVRRTMKSFDNTISYFATKYKWVAKNYWDPPELSLLHLWISRYYLCNEWHIDGKGHVTESGHIVLWVLYALQIVYHIIRISWCKETMDTYQPIFSHSDAIENTGEKILGSNTHEVKKSIEE